MSIQIDANSRAPKHRNTSTLKDYCDEETSNDAIGCSDTSSPTSPISFRAAGEPDGGPLSRCSSRGTAHKPADADDSEIWEGPEHSMIRRVSNKVKTKIGKAREVIAKEMDERREIRNLLQSCRNDILSSKVLDIDGAPCKRERSMSNSTTPTSTDGSDNQPLCADLPNLFPNASSFVSRTSRASSISSTFSITPRRKSSTPTTPGSDNPSPRTPLRQRRISRPLELDPQFQPSQLPPLPEHERSGSITPEKPSFRTPDWTPPTQDDCIACEIVRTITRQTILAPSTNSGEENDKASPTTKTFRKMSDAQGCDMFEQIQDTDSMGKKKVLLQWGKGVDNIIPSLPDHESVVGVPKHQLKTRLGSRFEGLGRKAKNMNARAWSKVMALSEALHFSPYVRIEPTGSEI